MIHRYYLPDDFFGFTIEEMKKIIMPVKGVNLIDKDWKYDMLKGYRIENVDRWHLKADSRKSLWAGIDAIKQAIIKRDPEIIKFKFKRVKW